MERERRGSSSGRSKAISDVTEGTGVRVKEMSLRLETGEEARELRAGIRSIFSAKPLHICN
jgi:hypothetical protein